VDQDSAKRRGRFRKSEWGSIGPRANVAATIIITGGCCEHRECGGESDGSLDPVILWVGSSDFRVLYSLP
jgi:hypothetical protein